MVWRGKGAGWQWGCVLRVCVQGVDTKAVFRQLRSGMTRPLSKAEAENKHRCNRASGPPVAGPLSVIIKA